MLVQLLGRTTIGIFSIVGLSAFAVAGCGDDGDGGGEGGSGGSSGTGASSSGGSAAQPCAGTELEDCLLRCDGLNSCSDAATQQACRDLCPISTPKACVDYDACTVQDFACENKLDCWDVFSGTTPVGTGGSGTGDPSCTTACANVTAKCGSDGGIDFATCTEQCPSFSSAQVACATEAATCDAILACIGVSGQ